MPKYKSKNKNHRLYVRAKFSSKERINTNELNFFNGINGKYLRGFLKANYIKKMTFKGIEYTGPMGISLYERLKKPVSSYEFLFIMEQIADLIRKLNNNALQVNKIEWNIQNVYINMTTCELQFIYLPLEERRENADIMGFVDSIIYSVKADVPKSLVDISAFVYFLRNQGYFNPDAVEKYIQVQIPGIVNTIKKHTIGQNGYITDKAKEYYAHYNGMNMDNTGVLRNEETGVMNRSGMFSSDGYEETGVMQNETGVLQGNYNIHYPTLVWTKTNEAIRVNKPVYRIGKDRANVDYCILNNSAVSRCHVDIITRGHRYFIIDLNSKNGTFINGHMITANTETEIKNQDSLRLANEDFIFVS